MAGKVYVAWTEWDTNEQTFHGVFSSGLKAKAIFGNRKWKRFVHHDGSWCWLSEGKEDDMFNYIVAKTNINQVTVKPHELH